MLRRERAAQVRGRKPRDCSWRSRPSGPHLSFCASRYHRPMRKLVAWVLVTVGIAALVRHLKRRRNPLPPAAGTAQLDDPAGELRRKLDASRTERQLAGSASRGSGLGAQGGGARRGPRRPRRDALARDGRLAHGRSERDDACLPRAVERGGDGAAGGGQGALGAGRRPPGGAPIAAVRRARPPRRRTPTSRAGRPTRLPAGPGACGCARSRARPRGVPRSRASCSRSSSSPPSPASQPSPGSTPRSSSS